MKTEPNQSSQRNAGNRPFRGSALSSAWLTWNAKKNFPMNTPEKAFKLQTQLSESSGTAKIAGWLMGISVLLFIWASVDAIAAKESLLRVAPSPLMLVALFVYMRSQAKRRTADLERQLES